MMHIITRGRLVEFWETHPDSKISLTLWYKLVRTAKWKRFIEVRKSFPSADKVGNLVVFNIGGNKYRLITYIDYTYRKIFIRNILTHAEYDKDAWKKDSWY